MPHVAKGNACPEARRPGRQQDTQPYTQTNRPGLTSVVREKAPKTPSGPFIWSSWAGLNRRPHPYQGCALPPELQEHFPVLIDQLTRNQPKSMSGDNLLSHGDIPYCHQRCIVRFKARTARDKACRYKNLRHGTGRFFTTICSRQIQSGVSQGGSLSIHDRYPRPQAAETSLEIPPITPLFARASSCSHCYHARIRSNRTNRGTLPGSRENKPFHFPGKHLHELLDDLLKNYRRKPSWLCLDSPAHIDRRHLA